MFGYLTNDEKKWTCWVLVIREYFKKIDGKVTRELQVITTGA